jgi:hypothetical protein
MKKALIERILETKKTQPKTHVLTVSTKTRGTVEGLYLSLDDDFLTLGLPKGGTEIIPLGVITDMQATTLQSWKSQMENKAYEAIWEQKRKNETPRRWTHAPDTAKTDEPDEMVPHPHPYAHP